MVCPTVAAVGSKLRLSPPHPRGYTCSCLLIVCFMFAAWVVHVCRLQFDAMKEAHAKEISRVHHALEQRFRGELEQKVCRYSEQEQLSTQMHCFASHVLAGVRITLAWVCESFWNFPDCREGSLRHSVWCVFLRMWMPVCSASCPCCV